MLTSVSVRRLSQWPRVWCQQRSTAPGNTSFTALCSGSTRPRPGGVARTGLESAEPLALGGCVAIVRRAVSSSAGQDTGSACSRSGAQAKARARSRRRAKARRRTATPLITAADYKPVEPPPATGPPRRPPFARLHAAPIRSLLAAGSALPDLDQSCGCRRSPRRHTDKGSSAALRGRHGIQ